MNGSISHLCRGVTRLYSFATAILDLIKAIAVTASTINIFQLAELEMLRLGATSGSMRAPAQLDWASLIKHPGTPSEMASIGMMSLL